MVKVGLKRAYSSMIALAYYPGKRTMMFLKSFQSQHRVVNDRFISDLRQQLVTED